MMKAKITGLADGGEFIPILMIVEQLGGEVLSIDYTITNIGELVVQFKDEGSVKEFDISVCDLGFDVTWIEQ